MDKRTAPEVRIEAIRDEHIDRFRASLDAVARERRFLALLEAPPIDNVREFVRSNIANGVPQFVALANDRIVGWCDISPHGREGFRHCGVVGMGVLSEFRGQGIGRRLLEAAMVAARQRDITRVELEVFASNTAAIELYKKLGFAVEGTKRKARFIDGAYDDIVCMAKFL